MKKLLLVAIFAALFGSHAMAQQPGCVNQTPCVQTNVFTPIGSATLSAGTTTSNVALPNVLGNLTVVVTNQSTSVVAYLNYGGSSVTATTSNNPIQPGQTIAVIAGANTYIAGITGSSTASLLVQVGTGVPNITYQSAAGGGSLGSVTQGTTPWIESLSYLNGVALGSPSNYGTSPGAVTVPGVNAFITNTPPVSQSGTWTVQPGNTPNTTPWLSTINQGGNSATVSAGGALKVDNSAVTQPVSGTFWQTTQPVTVTPAPVAPTVSASGSVTSLVLKASATSSTGGVQYYHAENATATGGYCILYNGTTAPSTGALTAANVLGFQLLPASGYCDWHANMQPPIAASTGAVLLVSSGATPFTYTTGTITASIYGLAQ